MVAVRRLIALTTLGALALVAGAFVLAGQARTDALAAPDDVQQDIPPGHIVVSGQIQYIDRESDRNHPAAGVRVEIWDKDDGFPTTSEKLAEVRADANGFYESPPIPNTDRDGPGGEPGTTTQDIFFKLYTDSGPVALLEYGTNRQFVWQSYEINERTGLKSNVPDGLVSMGRLVIEENVRDVEALWTFVNMSEAWLFMQEKTGRTPGNLVGYWSNDLREGPKYDPESRELFFRYDSAGYADVVVQQTAYALLHDIYGTLPAGWEGCTAGPEEALTKPADTAACALVQGFASFLPLALYEEPIFTSLSVRALDMDAPEPVSPGWENGDTVPGRIAGAYWDLYEGDQTVETHDRFNATFDDIWDVFADRKPETMMAWWEGWKALGKDACGASGSLYQNSIDYNAGPDIQPIPDQVLDEDTSTSFDLLDYVSDEECGDDQLEFEITDYGDSQAGVELVNTSVISITPAANWFGQTRVRLNVSDQAQSIPVDFLVIVRSVNDCPIIEPRLEDPQPAQYGETIVIDVRGRGNDVEDSPGDLTWGVQMEPQDQTALTVTGADTGLITFELDSTILTDYNARVNVTLTDKDGCVAEFPTVLVWTARPNNPPFIFHERLTKEYIYPINTTIRVDLTGVANDDEDGPDDLEWFVNNPGDLDAQIARVTHQTFDFDPDVDFVGSNRVELEVRDSVGARATANITLTWKPADEFNVPPQILRNRLRGKTVGSFPDRPVSACYALADKAQDPDDPVRSLRWFLDDYNPSNLLISGSGTQQLCLTPRVGFIGCETARFIVRDPKGGEDSEEYTTCWREIKINLPRVDKTRY